jgi:hypothetical protein
MKNSMKKILLTVIFLTVISFGINGQTNVSGGIYSNTVWTLANSPYIVTDTVVVFPGVTLTIQPGVTVKFENDKRIEIRNAKLIAIGTATDSITFTSNAAIPTPGIWSSIFLNDCPNPIKISYCNFKYGLMGVSGSGDTLIIKNSNFNYNSWQSINYGQLIKLDSCNFKNSFTGIANVSGYLNMNNCDFKDNIYGVDSWDGNIIMNTCRFKNNTTAVNGDNATFINMDNCVISNNQTGVHMSNNMGQLKIINSIVDSNSVYGLNIIESYHDTVINCKIKRNEIGIFCGAWVFITMNIIEENNYGIKVGHPQFNIFCNKICNDTTYDLYYETNVNANISNNYWCTSDSAIISSHIYDGYDNISIGLLTFLPIDTINCYLITEIPINKSMEFSFTIFPNPASDHLTLKFAQNTSKAEIKIYNLLGELRSTSRKSSTESTIDISDLSSGVYIIEVTTEKNIMRQKFIKQ